MSDTTTSLFVVRVSSPDISTAAIQEKMDAVVLGRLSPISKLQEITDWAAIKKVSHKEEILPHTDFSQYHKLNTEIAIKEAQAIGDLAGEHTVVDTIVISSVAMKSVMA